MIYYHVNMTSLRAVEDALNQTRDKSKMALKAAINSAAVDISKRMIKGVKAEYQLAQGQKSQVNKKTKVHKARTANLKAVIEVSSTIGELYNFQVSPRTRFKGNYHGGDGAPSWIRGKVKRAASLQRIAARPGASGDKFKGFVTTFDSGHTTMVERVPGTRSNSDPKHEKIRTLYSNSITKMEEMIYRRELQGQVEDILANEIRKQVERMLPVRVSNV